MSDEGTITVELAPAGLISLDERPPPPEGTVIEKSWEPTPSESILGRLGRLVRW